MARFNEILTGRHNRFVQKLFGIKGGPPAAQLSSEIQMVHPFFHGAENRLLESWTLWGGGNVIASGVGLFGNMQLRNPPGSNVLAVVEKISFSSDAASKVLITILAKQTDLTTVLSPAARDTRQVGTAGTAILSSTNVATSTGPILAQEASAAGPASNMILTDNQEVVITPGFALIVQNGTANTIFVVTIFWRERALEEGEFK